MIAKERLWLSTLLVSTLVLHGEVAAENPLAEHPVQTDPAPDEDEDRSDEPMQAVVELLRDRQGEAAYAAFSRPELRSRAAQPCVASIEEGFAELAQLESAKKRFADALAGWDRRGILAAIDDSILSDVERTILYLYADVYVADFQRANARLSAWRRGSSEDRTPRDAGLAERLARRIAESRNEYEKYAHWLEFLAGSSRGHFHGWMSNGVPYVPEGMDERASSLAEVDLRVISSARLTAFIEAADRLQEVSPLSDLAASSFFLMNLYFAPYEDFEKYADASLAGLRVLSVPFDAESGLAMLELDATERRVKGAPGRIGDFASYARDDWVTALEPFDWSVDEVTEVSQSAHFVVIRNRHTKENFAVEISRWVASLELEPRGRVGSPILLNDFTVVFGAEAAKRLLHDLGGYVLHWVDDEHVTRRSESRLVHVDPSRSGGGVLRTLARLLTAQEVEFRPANSFENAIEEKVSAPDVLSADRPERQAARAFDVLEEERFAGVADRLFCLP